MNNEDQPPGRTHSSSSRTKNDELKGKTLLVINTGSHKKRFTLQRLKKLGLNLVVVNKEQNWAQPYVDHWIISDTYNHAETLENISLFKKSTNIPFDGVLTFWEDDVLLTSKIVDRFNLIGIPHSITKKARNKYLFREFCRENGIPAPKYQYINSETDLRSISESLNFPLVLKPAYGSSSAFVIKVEREADLKNVYQFVKGSISNNVESALSDGLDIFVEEFIDGDEVDIDILLQNGKIKFATISDNFNKSRDIFFVDSGQAIPSDLPWSTQKALLELAEEILEKLGVQNGCLHFEAKSTKNGPVPLELNLRLGGDYVYSYVKGAWNIDLIEYAAKIATGQYFKIKEKKTPLKHIIGWDLQAENSGILVNIDIHPKLKKKPCVEDIQIYKEIGDPLFIPPEGYESLGWITVSGDNSLDARDNLDEALGQIRYKIVKFDPESSLGKTERRDRFAAAIINKNALLRKAKLERVRRATHTNQRNLRIGVACTIYPQASHPIEREINTTSDAIISTLQNRGYQTTTINLSKLPEALQILQKNNIDLIFNSGDRVFNTNFKPQIAALFDALQLPYTGSNFLTLALALDKIRCKKILSYHDIPTPAWDYIYEIDDEVDDELGYPLIVKPGNSDYSIGITNESVVNNKQELQKQLEKVVIQMQRPALIEEYIPGDEYDVAILGTKEEEIKVMPLSRTIFDKLPQNCQHIYTYPAKWNSDPNYNLLDRQTPPKNISKKLTSLLTEIALDTYSIMHCQDYGIVEIRVDSDNNPYVLELNTNPLLAPNSVLPQTARLLQLDYGDLIEEIIALTIKRYKKT